MAGERARERSFMRRLPIRRAGWTMALAAAVAFGAARVATEQSTADQERRSTGPDSVQERSAARSLRPAVMGRSGAVSAGHPLTTAAGFEILLKGGNAFDAGVATLLVGGVVEQDLYSLGGEALILVYPPSEAKVTSVVGLNMAGSCGSRP